MRRLATLSCLLATAALTLGCSDQAAPPTDAAATLEPAQVSAAGTRNYFAPLRLDVEVPFPTIPAGPPPIGAAGFQLSRDRQSIFYQVMIARLNNTLMAHIHLGPPGEAGPVVVWLYPSGPPPQLIPGEFNGVLGEGVITAANLVGPLAGQPLSALIQQIDAGNAYVNVHTELNPPGEIRGQIFRIRPPDPPLQ